MFKSMTACALCLVCLAIAGCSEKSKSQVDKAKQRASGAVADAAGKAKDVAAQVGDALKNAPGGTELLAKVNDLFAAAGTALKDVKDSETAKAALPKLKELIGSTDGISKSLAGLPEGARSALAPVFEKGIAELKALVDKILALPGVESTIKPAVTELMGKLSALVEKKKE